MRINLDEIKEILEDYDELGPGFDKYSKTYLTTTENISGILENIDVEGKDVLAVAGSGDQMLNAYLKGANKVKVFDINPLTYAQIDLKNTALKNIKYEDFGEFFIPESKHNPGEALNYKTFNRISSLLKDDVASYYDYLYSNFTPTEIFYKTIQQFAPTLNTLKRISNYMNEEDYYKLANIMQEKEIEFLEADVLDLPDELTDTYDAMLLSNISDVLEYLWDINVLKSYKRFIHILSHNLKKDGIIQCGYIYSTYRGNAIHPIFAKKFKRQAVFDKKEFDEIKIRAYKSYSGTDKIVTYQKKRGKA